MTKRELLNKRNELAIAISEIKVAHKNIVDLCDDEYINCLDDQLYFIQDKLEEILISCQNDLEEYRYEEE